MRREPLTCAIVAFLLGGALLAGAEAWNPRKKFTLVYNVNSAGYIDVCGCKHKEVRQGSLTRRSSFLKQLRSTGRDVLFLDGGSALFTIKDRIKPAEEAEAFRKAELIVATYNRMGYRAMAVGTYDLAIGLDKLLELEKKARFTFLSANLRNEATGELYFRPHLVEEVAGVRVGIIGLSSQLGKAFAEKNAPGAVVDDPIEATKKSISELDGKVDLLIVLSHLLEENTFALLDELDAIDIAIDPFIQYGNHHTWIKDHEWVDYRNDTVLLRSDGQGARLGVLDIEMVDPKKGLVGVARLIDIEDRIDEGTATDAEKALLDGAGDLNLFEFNRVSLEPHHLTDPDIDHLIEEWKKNVDPSRVAALEAALPHKGDFLTTEKCSGCHEAQYTFWKGTKHAHALATLEANGDQNRFDCVGCHTLGYGLAYLDTTSIGKFADVQCESCHGTNPAHAEEPKAHPYARIEKEACLVCHNKEQTLKDFNFFQARRQVACPKS